MSVKILWKLVSIGLMEIQGWVVVQYDEADGFLEYNSRASFGLTTPQGTKADYPFVLFLRFRCGLWCLRLSKVHIPLEP